MTEYVCFGCNENCVRDDHDLEDMGILVGGEVYDAVCPYCGFDTEFVRRDEEDDSEEGEE